MHTVGYDFPCPNCESKFKVKRILLRHIEYVHNKQSDEVFSSTICLKELFSKAKLSHHIKSHEEKVQCEICKLPIFQSSLMKHKKRRHKNMTLPKQRLMKNQKCELCNQTFATLESLKKHKTIHTIRTSEFKCSMCENRFLSQRNLQSHMITHTSEKPFQCDECSKTFNNHGSLLKHKESQHKETRINCDNCN